MPAPAGRILAGKRSDHQPIWHRIPARNSDNNETVCGAFSALLCMDMQALMNGRDAVRRRKPETRRCLPIRWPVRPCSKPEGSRIDASVAPQSFSQWPDRKMGSGGSVKQTGHNPRLSFHSAHAPTSVVPLSFAPPGNRWVFLRAPWPAGGHWIVAQSIRLRNRPSFNCPCLPGRRDTRHRAPQACMESSLAVAIEETMPKRHAFPLVG